MSILQGGDEYSVDSKGRVKIPSKMLKNLSGEASEVFHLTIGQDNCIDAYPACYWVNIEKKLEGLNKFDIKNKFFLRKFLMNSEKVELDAQQRLVLPKKLIEQAGISDTVQIIGLVDHIEFWDPQRYKEYEMAFEGEYDKISAEVMS
jgi:MraZ protein